MSSVPVRFPAEQVEAIREEAEEMGVSMAAFIRESTMMRVTIRRAARGLTPDGYPMVPVKPIDPPPSDPPPDPNERAG